MYIDCDAAINDGLTVAQIYQAIYGKLTTSTIVTSVNLAGEDLDVEIVTGLEPINVQNIMDYISWTIHSRSMTRTRTEMP